MIGQLDGRGTKYDSFVREMVCGLENNVVIHQMLPWSGTIFVVEVLRSKMHRVTNLSQFSHTRQQKA